MSNTLWPAPVQHYIIVLGCKIPHELDALKWKAIGRRGRRRRSEYMLASQEGFCILQLIIFSRTYQF
jgi:hypothetical protein